MIVIVIVAEISHRLPCSLVLSTLRVKDLRSLRDVALDIVFFDNGDSCASRPGQIRESIRGATIRNPTATV